MAEGGETGDGYLVSGLSQLNLEQKSQDEEIVTGDSESRGSQSKVEQNEEIRLSQFKVEQDETIEEKMDNCYKEIEPGYFVHIDLKSEKKNETEQQTKKKDKKEEITKAPKEEENNKGNETNGTRKKKAKGKGKKVETSTSLCGGIINMFMREKGYYDPRKYDNFTPKGKADEMSKPHYELWKVEPNFDIKAFFDHVVKEFSEKWLKKCQARTGITIHLCIIIDNEKLLLSCKISGVGTGESTKAPPSSVANDGGIVTPAHPAHPEYVISGKLPRGDDIVDFPKLSTHYKIYDERDRKVGAYLRSLK